MASNSKICYLKCVKNAQKIINLPHQKPILIGRNEQTGITDQYMSRNQLECTADFSQSKVFVKTLGKSHSGCNGYALMQGETYTLKHDDRIEVRLGYHEFDIVFESPKENAEPAAKKQKMDFFNLKTGSSNNGKLLESGKWEEIDGNDLLIYTPDNCTPQSSVAAFDLDGTIIRTKSGATFPKDIDDWVFNFTMVQTMLRQLYYEQNHKVVIFSNQSGLGNDLSKIEGYKRKIGTIIRRLSVPMQVFIATSKSIYRKPAPGMWNALCEVKNSGILVNLDKSFFVGDAAGRKEHWAPKKKKDHSISDRLFALNVGLKFYTPEEYFNKSSPVPYIMPEFDPRAHPHSSYPDVASEDQEVVLMVGGPGAGKSYYCRRYLIPKGYVHVSRDQSGTWQKCAKLLESCINRKEKVVIDNTNHDKESRQRFVDIARRHRIPCRCFVMDVTHKHAKHNNKFREFTDKSHAVIGEALLNSYKKKYQEPELSEGFSEIVKVPFIPKFDNPEHEKLYQMFLLGE